VVSLRQTPFDVEYRVHNADTLPAADHRAALADYFALSTPLQGAPPLLMMCRPSIQYRAPPSHGGRDVFHLQHSLSLSHSLSPSLSLSLSLPPHTLTAEERCFPRRAVCRLLRTRRSVPRREPVLRGRAHAEAGAAGVPLLLHLLLQQPHLAHPRHGGAPVLHLRHVAGCVRPRQSQPKREREVGSKQTMPLLEDGGSC
jgi:hypothetical protein